MNRFIFWLSALLATSGCRSQRVEVVSRVDLSKYAGTWFEVARLPNSFERNLKCVTATYTLQKDGTITVVNKGINEKSRMEEQVTGKARQLRGGREGQLEVSFFLNFYQDYQIIALDNSYQFALVGNRTFGYLWILSRAPILDESVYKQLCSKAVEQGFDISNLHRTVQNCGQGATVMTTSYH